MTLAAQLRAIADRLEAAEAEYAAAREAARGELVAAIHADTPVVPLTEAQQQLVDALRRARDSAAVPVAAGAGAEVSRPSATGPSAPIEQAGSPGGASAGDGSHDPSPSAPPDNAGAVRKVRTPARHAGGAGSIPATRSNTQAETSRQPQPESGSAGARPTSGALRSLESKRGYQDSIGRWVPDPIGIVVLWSDVVAALAQEQEARK